MRRSDMVAARSRTTRPRARPVAATCLTLAVAVTTSIATPSVVRATSLHPIAVAAAPHPTSLVARVAVGPVADVSTDVRPTMCRPEPPDYPGCTIWQVRPLMRALFRAEYTGHAYGYRYFRMGQHPRGVIFAHLLPKLNAHLAALYRQAVRRYAAEHTSIATDSEGVKHIVVSYPRYRTWAGFRANTTSFCTVNDVTRRFPAKYCAAITLLGQIGARVNMILQKTLGIFFSCDGFAIGGWTSGAYVAWRLGTGALRGGFYGAVSTEIACQTVNLWNWITDKWWGAGGRPEGVTT